MDAAAGVVERYLARPPARGDPGYRQRGVARALLAAGIARLRACGAGSLTVGVDAIDPAPSHL